MIERQEIEKMLKEYPNLYDLERAIEVSNECGIDRGAIFNLISAPLLESNVKQVIAACRFLGIKDLYILEGNAQTNSVLATIQNQTGADIRILQIYSPKYLNSFPALWVHMNA